MHIQTTTARTNRTYRDSIFVDLFARDRDAKKNFLSLYNALHGTDLKPEETKIEPVELEQVLYMGQYNDVSMLVDGRDELPAISELRLSTAFIRDRGETKDFQLELTVPVYNLNRLEEIPGFGRCATLKGYTEFVRIVVEERAKDGNAYMERAVRAAEKAGVLAEYLTRKNKEVENMYWGEYDYETDMRVQREEAAHDKAIETARAMLNYGDPAEKIAAVTGLSAEEVAQLTQTAVVR